VFGLGLCGLGWLQLSFWGWLQPLFCLVAGSGSFQFLVWFEDCKGLEPTSHLFGWMDWNGPVDLVNARHLRPIHRAID